MLKRGLSRLKLGRNNPKWKEIPAESPLPGGKDAKASAPKSNPSSPRRGQAPDFRKVKSLSGLDDRKKRPAKVLLLGTAGSGKTTLLKHALLLVKRQKAANGRVGKAGALCRAKTEAPLREEDEKEDLRVGAEERPGAAKPAKERVRFHREYYLEMQQVSRQNCISFLIFLIKKLEVMEMLRERDMQKQSEFHRALAKVLEYRTEQFDPSKLNWMDIEKLRQSIRFLWQHPAVQKGFACRGLFYSSIQNIEYFLDKSDEVYTKGWTPLNEEVFMCRQRTTGIIHRDMKIHTVQGEKALTVYDVGGTRNERRKWVSLFDSTDTLIFTANLCGYRNIMFEDEFYYDILESLDLFQELLTYRTHSFERTRVALVLTHRDALREGLRNGYTLNCVGCFDPQYPIPEIQAMHKREPWAGAPWEGPDFVPPPGVGAAFTRDLHNIEIDYFAVIGDKMKELLLNEPRDPTAEEKEKPPALATGDFHGRYEVSRDASQRVRLEAWDALVARQQEARARGEEPDGAANGPRAKKGGAGSVYAPAKKRKRVKLCDTDEERLKECFDAAVRFVAAAFLEAAKPRRDVQVFVVNTLDEMECGRVWESLAGQMAAGEDPNKPVDAMALLEEQLKALP